MVSWAFATHRHHLRHRIRGRSSRSGRPSVRSVGLRAGPTALRQIKIDLPPGGCSAGLPSLYGEISRLALFSESSLRSAVEGPDTEPACHSRFLREGAQGRPFPVVPRPFSGVSFTLRSFDSPFRTETNKTIQLCNEADWYNRELYIIYPVAFWWFSAEQSGKVHWGQGNLYQYTVYRHPSLPPTITGLIARRRPVPFYPTHREAIRSRLQPYAALRLSLPAEY